MYGMAFYYIFNYAYKKSVTFWRDILWKFTITFVVI